MKFIRLLVALPLLLLSLSAVAAERTYVSHPEARTFIDEMVGRHDFNTVELANLFAQVSRNKIVLDAIQRPAEAKPWYDYRPIFLTEERVRAGVEFWRANAETLARAEREYGVPAEVIVAIIGVETFYGRRMGNFRVVDALATLAFDYPKRAKLFRAELEQFLLMTREEKLNPLLVKGSYAGAMGFGQFMPSSFRAYAIDFDGDGRRDLIGSQVDAIGSVANYFSRHGWSAGEQVVAPARVEGELYKSLLTTGLKPKLRIARLAQYGVTPGETLPESKLAALIELEQKGGHEYWLGMNNFYVITRYNHSALYAMAAWQLSGEIKAARSRLAEVSPFVSGAGM